MKNYWDIAWEIGKKSIVLWIDLVEFYKYLTTWNYPTFTNELINWWINIAILIKEKTLNPKLWTQFLLSRSSFLKPNYANTYQRTKTFVVCYSCHSLSFHHSPPVPPSLMTIIHWLKLMKSFQLMYFHSHSNAFGPIIQKVLPLMIPPSLERNPAPFFFLILLSPS